jgi:hypothetical protein
VTEARTVGMRVSDQATEATSAIPDATAGAQPGKRTRTERLPQRPGDAGARSPQRDPVGHGPASHPAPLEGGLLGLTDDEWDAARAPTATSERRTGDGAQRAAHRRPASPAQGAHDDAIVTIEDATRQEILTMRNDLTVSVYPRYQDGVRDPAQFVRSATSHATNYRALAIVDGRLAMGHAIAIQRLTDAQHDIAAVGAALRSIDPALRIHNVALFAHGEPSGMGLDARNHFTLHGTRDRPQPRRGQRPGDEHRENAPLDAASQTIDPSVAAFRDAIRSSVSADVRFLLFGCSTGRDQGVAQNDVHHWQGHGDGERWGNDSFAQELADAFGPEASTYAHATYGHATENSASLVFGRDAGGGRGGVHLFEQMYPRAFIEAQTRELLGEEASDQGLFQLNYDHLRDRMHSHWMSRVNPNGTHHMNLAREGAGRGPRPIGQEMFTRPTVAAAALQADWIEHRAEIVRPWSPRRPPPARTGRPASSRTPHGHGSSDSDDAPPAPAAA